MPVTSEIPAELIAAYRATTYRVESAELIIDLVIDQFNHELAVLHLQHRVNSSAFITAFNPYSIQTSRNANTTAHEALVRHIDSMHLPWLGGVGVGTDPNWSPERSVLVGISFEQVNTLAHLYRQNAFIFCDESAVPTLHLCR